MNGSPLHPGSSSACSRNAGTSPIVAQLIIGLSVALLWTALPRLATAGPGCAIRPVGTMGLLGSSGSNPAWPVPASFGVRSLVVFPGLWIAIDPVTRRPVPPSVEQRLGPNRAPIAPEGDNFLPVERLPNGTEMIHLRGRHEVFEVARRGASGRFRTTCAEDSSAAARVLSMPVASRQAVDR